MTHDQAQLPQVNGLLTECGTCEENHLLFPSAPSACSSFLVKHTAAGVMSEQTLAVKDYDLLEQSSFTIKKG
jgi:hypothetical protein